MIPSKLHIPVLPDLCTLAHIAGMNNGVTTQRNQDVKP